MQTIFSLALNIVLNLDFLNMTFFMNFTGQILLKTKKDNSISRLILFSRVVPLMSFSFCWTWKCTQSHKKTLMMSKYELIDELFILRSTNRWIWTPLKMCSI